MPFSGPNQNAEEREMEMENIFGKKRNTENMDQER